MGKKITDMMDALRLGQKAERQGRRTLAPTTKGATQAVLNAKRTGVGNERN